MTKIIKVIELFSGIGSQTQALKNQNIEHEVVGISEWSINSIISYGEIHTPDPNYIPLKKEDILERLKDCTFSSDTKKPTKIKRLKEDKLNLLYKNHINSKNLGSIMDIDGSKLNCDLLTYSFPCQDISILGKQTGLYDGKSSSLLWEVGRLLGEIKELPEILLMENVDAILHKPHIEGFNKWKDFLKNKGYYNYVLKLKSSNYDIPQNRNRCYMVSSLKEIDNIEENVKGTMTKLRIKDILEPIDEKYLRPDMENYLPNDIKFNNTKNNIKHINLISYSKWKSDSKIYNIDSIAPTLTTSLSLHILLNDNKIKKLTTLECWKLMGFTKKEYNKVCDIHTDRELYKQAGNSIVVNVLEKIFNIIYLQNKL